MLTDKELEDIYNQIDNNTIPEIYINNKEVILYSIKRDPNLFQGISNRLKNDIDIVTACLEFVDVRMVYNKISCKAEVATNKTYQSPSNKRIRKIRSTQAFGLASPEIKNNKTFIKKHIDKIPEITEHLLDLAGDEDIIMAAIKADFPNAIEYYCESAAENKKQFIIKAIQQNVLCLKYYLASWKLDVDFVKVALEKDIRVTWNACLTDEAMENLEVLKHTFKLDPILFDKYVQFSPNTPKEIFNRFASFIKHENEDYFTQIFLKMDYEQFAMYGNDTTNASPNRVGVQHERTLDLILSYISKENLQSMQLQTPFLIDRVIKEIKKKVILETPMLSHDSKKSKTRKVSI